MTQATIHAVDVYEAGSTEDGLNIRLNLSQRDGSHQWLELPAVNVGKFFSAMIFASGVAAQNRPPVQDMLGQRIEQSSLIDPESFEVTAIPGTNFVILRMTLAPAVHLDFRLPLESLAPMQSELSRAALLANSSDRPSRAH